MEKTWGGLQFIMSRSSNLPLPAAQIWHPHNLNDQTRPACEMLRSLSFPCLGIILLPRKASFGPRIVDCLDEVQSEVAVQFTGGGLVRTFNLGIFLFCLLAYVLEAIGADVPRVAKQRDNSYSSRPVHASNSHPYHRTHPSYSDF